MTLITCRATASVQNGPMQRSSSTSSILASAKNKAFPTGNEDAQLLENQKFRPASVIGPLGEALTLESLPHPSTRRWVIRRKAEVVAAVAGGLLTIDEACQRYNLTIEEFTGWQRSVHRSGMPGLRVTRIQLYRRLHERQDAGARDFSEARHGHGDLAQLPQGGQGQGPSTLDKPMDSAATPPRAKSP